MIELKELHLDAVVSLPVREAVIRLLTDEAGPLSDCAARVEDGPAAYMLGTLYRYSRGVGLLHGKPAHEAVEMFASRVRTTARRALDPFAWAVSLARALGVRWESLSEEDRVWWRGRARDLSVGPDGATLTTEWTRIRQPARLGDLITSARIASDWIGVVRESRKEST
jgi:hypothetical protein